MFCDMHIFTRESHEVMLGTVNVSTDDLAPATESAAKSLIVSTAIPHFGQLNVTNSTLSTPA